MSFRKMFVPLAITFCFVGTSWAGPAQLLNVMFDVARGIGKKTEVYERAAMKQHYVGHLERSVPTIQVSTVGSRVEIVAEAVAARAARNGTPSSPGLLRFYVEKQKAVPYELKGDLKKVQADVTARFGVDNPMRFYTYHMGYGVVEIPASSDPAIARAVLNGLLSIR